MNPNSAILDQQFLEPVAEVAGIKLQPFSPGILTCARKLGLKLIIGTEQEKADLTAADQQYELMAILFLLANDRETVKRAVASGAEAFRSAVESFEFLIPVQALPEAITAITKIVEQANIASVETLPKPQTGGDAGAQPPPNS